MHWHLSLSVSLHSGGLGCSLWDTRLEDSTGHWADGRRQVNNTHEILFDTHLQSHCRCVFVGGVDNEWGVGVGAENKQLSSL